MNDELLFFNGIDGDSGDYLTEPMSPQSLAALARGERPDPRHLDELRWKQRQPEESNYDWAEGIDPKNLAETGWGVIFPFDEDPAVREALRELLDHRRNQATKKNEQYYKEYVGPGAYRPGESKRDFLARCGVGFGPAHPEKVPYYLLIVASPEKISYRFQYQLDVQYAVGRIYFDTPEEYAHYARRVVDAETRAETKALRVAFVGVANPDDKATAMSTDLLVQPLARAMSADYPNWKVEAYLGDRATKERLLQVMGGNDTPTLLFTASHGMGFPNGDPRQLGSQGALLCQNWPGPKNWGRRPIPPDFYL